MTALENLPPDERAVLQLVLQRGRGYDDIARLLAIDRAAVRQRALSAFDALGPETRLPSERRALITDYLLGQLPRAVRDQVRGRLAQSASERAWARVVAAELAPIAAEPLPEIPIQSARRVDEQATAPMGDPERATTPPAEPAQAPEGSPQANPDGDGEDDEQPAGRTSWAPQAPAEAVAGAGAWQSESAFPSPPPSLGRRNPRSGRGSRFRAAADQPGQGAPGPRAGAAAKRSSRPGGALLLAILGIAVVVVIVLALTSGGGTSSSSRGAALPATTSTPASPAAPGATGATGSTGRRGPVPTPTAQFNLYPTTPGSKAKGVVEVLKAGKQKGVAVVATGLTPNTRNPPSDYAVWLYNSPSDTEWLGFVKPPVGSTGNLDVAGGVDANAGRFRELIVTLETATSQPKTPGRIVLAGRTKGL